MNRAVSNAIAAEIPAEYNTEGDNWLRQININAVENYLNKANYQSYRGK